MPTSTAPDDPAGAYAVAVTSGRVAASQQVGRACARHLADLDRADGVRFDRGAANRAIDFFRFLRHSKGEWAGQALDLADWQKFIVGSLYGWKKADGLRRFSVAYVEVPRKNGKSTLAAGIGLYGLVADGEAGAEVYAAATKRDQAKIVFNEAKRMVLKSSALRRRATVLENNLNVVETASRFEPLGANYNSMDGLNVHLAVIDELHRHKSRGVLDVLETATGSRRQPLIFIITTAGSDRESVCWQTRSYAEKVLDGIFADDTLFTYIATLDEGDDWRDPALWPKANPNLGVSVKPAYLAGKVNAARNNAAQQNAIKRLNFNLWAQEADAWLNLEQWDACQQPVEAGRLAGRACWAGLDLSSKLDLSCFCMVFPPLGDDPFWYLLPRFWLPEKRVELVRAGHLVDRAPYDRWAEAGLLTVTGGDIIDHGRIERDIAADAGAFAIEEIGYDPYNATQLVVGLMGAGFAMVEMRQGWVTMSEPLKEFEAQVEAGRLAHGGHPIPRWNAANIAVKIDDKDNYTPSKRHSTGRIDGIVAAAMGFGRILVNQGGGGSVYETGEFFL